MNSECFRVAVLTKDDNFLIGFRNRVQVLLSWFWNWFLNARDARLITGKAQIHAHTPLPVEFVRFMVKNPLHEETGT